MQVQVNHNLLLNITAEICTIKCKCDNNDKTQMRKKNTIKLTNDSATFNTCMYR